MIFKEYTVNPRGRNRYGEYLSAGNISQSIVGYNNGGNASTAGGETNTGSTKQTVNWNMALSQTSCAFEGDKLPFAAQSASTQLFGFLNSERAYTYIGDISSSAATPNYGISGITSGISVNVTNNSTTATTLTVTAASGMTNTKGTLIVPCNVYIGRGVMDNEPSSWHSDSGNCMTMNFELTWNVTNPKPSAYVLELTNQNASVNCDSAGTIYSASTAQLSCTAKLYLGNEEYTGATYAIDNRGVTAITINSSTGVLSFGNNMQFADSPLIVFVSANVGGATVGTRTMSIVKSYPGEDGTPAVTKWLTLSAKALAYNPNTSAVTPDTITATAMMQTAGDEPVAATAETIYYGYDTATPSLTGTGVVTITNIDTTKNYLNFGLKSGLIYYELESVPILRDGANGQQGEAGRNGAALRGAYLWGSSEESRRFCNGQGPESGDTQYIDIIYRYEDNEWKYYRCSTSYNGTLSDAWSAVSANWTVSEVNCDFVAARVLLAENASIDFLTGNELYLRDDNSEITAGAAGGTGVTFWAGSENPNNANFKVDYQGNMTATTANIQGVMTGTVNASGGTIGGLHIEGNSLTNENFQNDATIVLRNDNNGTFAAIGGNVLPPSMGTSAVARFENHEDSGLLYGENYAAICDAQSARTNVALSLSAGSISGIRYRNSIITHNYTSTDLYVTLNKFENNVMVIGTGTKDLILTLPEVKYYDDGLIIKIRNMMTNNDGKIKIRTGKADYINGGAVAQSYPVICYNKNGVIYPSTVNPSSTNTNTLGPDDFIYSKGDSSDFIFFRDISYTYNGTTYHGAWVQYFYPQIRL